MARTVTFQGTSLTLEGQEVKVGQNAPDFRVVDKDLNEKTLKDYSGKVKVISVTPSLDTPVCDMQARRFNEEASKLPQNVVMLNISMDLPFAIARFCTTVGIDRVEALSDHREASFGLSYGVLIKELRLLARAVFVIDKDDIIRYIEIVPEITEQPNYDRAIEAMKSL
jgi:thiol peroxidase